MTSKLELYNSALTICGERHTTLTESREPRRLLDHVWDNGGVKACLEMGQWKFAMRTVKIDYDASITTEFGFSRAFSKPDDWVITSAVCSDEYFNTPLTQYAHEGDYWYADLDEIYVKYVSNHADYGGDLSRWPSTFTDYAAAHFATKIIFKLTGDTQKRDDVIAWEKKQLSTAKNKDAQNQPQRFPAPGNFVRSRSRSTNNDRGNTGSLLG